jgi:hypothetical protein
MLDYLILNFGDLEMRDQSGWTAIHWAAADGWLDGCKRLYEAGSISIGLSKTAAHFRDCKVVTGWDATGKSEQYEEVIEFFQLAEATS